MCDKSICLPVCAYIKHCENISGSRDAFEFLPKEGKLCSHAEDDAMSEVLTVEAILFGLLVFSGILGNISVIHVVR